MSERGQAVTQQELLLDHAYDLRKRAMALRDDKDWDINVGVRIVGYEIAAALNELAVSLLATKAD